MKSSASNSNTKKSGVRRKIGHPSHNKIETLIDYGIDPTRRVIYLGSNNGEKERGYDGSIDFEAFLAFKKNLDFLNYSRGEIKLVMNTSGGTVQEGYAIFDAITSSKNPVDIYVTGQAMSIGAVILQGGRVRYISPNAIVMLHEGYQTWPDRTPSRTIEAWGKWSKLERERYYDILASRTGKAPSFWRKLCSQDVIYSANQAIKEGLADKITSASPWYSSLLK